ncbi:MAG: phytanoyl-CoA dioxygenase family protein [Novosphingobium sp.]|nr:phytanoyl-CoA dioxygenase family protein [Novosphingobium sp.]
MKPGSRQKVAARVSRLRPEFRDVRADGRRTELHSDGQVLLPDFIDAGQCEALYDHFRSKPVSDPYRAENGAFLPLSPDRPRDTHVAYHKEMDVVTAPGALAIANDPRVLSIVAAFMGCKPTLSYLTAWWSFGGDGVPQQAEKFHRDVDDWSFVKLFVYLTPVDENTGPHVYVRGSANDNKLAEIRRFDDAEVSTAFGADNIIPLTGKAGTGLIEDTFGIHKGQPVLSGERLMFQAVYSLSPLFYGPAKPLLSASELPPGLRIDPWINRRFVSQN